MTIFKQTLKKTLCSLVLAGSIATTGCVVDVSKPDVSLEKITQFTVEFTNKCGFNAPDVRLDYPNNVSFHWKEPRIVLYAHKTKEGYWNALMLEYKKSRVEELNDYKNWLLNYLNEYKKRFNPLKRGDING